MLLIYHFYDWTWSFCYCAYSNTFLSSLSSLYVLFNCITIVNLLHYRNYLFFILPLLPICCRIASEWPECSENQNSYQRDVIDAQKLLSGKKIYRVARVSGWSKFWSTRVSSQKRKGSEVPWKVLEEKVSCGNFGLR